MCCLQTAARRGVRGKGSSELCQSLGACSTVLLHPSHTEGRNAEYNIKYLRPCLGCCSANNCCCLAQFLLTSWQLREERETCSLQAGAVMLHMFTCKGGLNDFFMLQSAASPHGNLHPCLRVVWHTRGPSLSAPVGRKAQSMQSQQAERRGQKPHPQPGHPIPQKQNWK